MSMKRASKRTRGQSIVELAIALPLMLMILLGTVDLGRTFWAYVQMRNAAWEGARYAATAPTSVDEITHRVETHGGPSNMITAVTCTPESCDSITANEDATVTVTVTARFTPIVSGFTRKFLGIGPYTMTARATARVAT